MKKKIKIIFIILLIVFLTYNLTGLFKTNKNTIIAQIDTIELTKEFDGIICKNEQFITFDVPKGGMLDFSVMENELVKRGKLLAVCYDKDIDEEKKKKLSEINRKIAEINSSPTEVGALEINPDKLDKQIGEIMTEIITISPERDISKVTELKDDVTLLLGRKLTASGNTEVATDTLESLRMEKQQIEREYGGKKSEIISPAHGVFSTHLDGYETLLTPKKALSMTISDVEKVRNGEGDKKTDNNVIAKLVDNTSWWFSVISSVEDTKEFSVGDTMNFRVGTDGETISARVEYISMPENGKSVITFMTEDYCDLMLTSRTISVEAIKNSYTGFKIPLGAIHVKNDKAGVYVRTDAGVKFREIDVIYKDEHIAIAKMDNHKANGLLLYDEILTDWEGV